MPSRTARGLNRGQLQKQSRYFVLRIFSQREFISINRERHMGISAREVFGKAIAMIPKVLPELSHFVQGTLKFKLRLQVIQELMWVNHRDCRLDFFAVPFKALVDSNLNLSWLLGLILLIRCGS